MYFYYMTEVSIKNKLLANQIQCEKKEHQSGREMMSCNECTRCNDELGILHGTTFYDTKMKCILMENDANGKQR